MLRTLEWSGFCYPPTCEDQEVLSTEKASAPNCLEPKNVEEQDLPSSFTESATWRFFLSSLSQPCASPTYMGSWGKQVIKEGKEQNGTRGEKESAEGGKKGYKRESQKDGKFSSILVRE